jgi:hypothetical protein
MSPITNRITIIKPSWPSSWNDSITAWGKMHSVICNEFGKDYSINIISTSHGLSGVKVAQNHILNNIDRSDLFIAYHLNSSYPKSISYKGAYYESLWYFGNNGYSGFSDITNKDLLKNIDIKNINYDEFYNNRIIPFISKTKYESDNRKQIESNIPQNEFLFVALQVENDSVMILKQIETIKMIERVIEVSNIVGLPVVIKCHPKAPNSHKISLYVKRLRDNVETKNKNIFISEGNVKELLNRCKAVFIVNSGVGFEGLIRLKPVFTFGKADYNQGAYNNYSVSQIVDVLNQDTDKNKIKQFLYHWWQEIIDFNDNTYYNKIKAKVLEKVS